VLHLQQLGKAEDCLERVVDLVRDAGHELADRGESLLPNDLVLKRFELLAHAALLGHLRVERGPGFVETLNHLGKRTLKSGKLVGRHRPLFDRAEISRTNPLSRRLQVADGGGQAP
jgi:hypothetical protein